MNPYLVINKKDNVGVCLEETERIPAGHKYALCNLSKGDPVIKYGVTIGRATCEIRAGEWVHTHNMKTHLDEIQEYTYFPDFKKFDLKEATFKGFPYKDGRAGIRNEIFIIPTVGCVNNVCLRLEKEAQKYVRGSLDGVFALTHQFGCSQLGDDGDNIKKFLCSIALNPNASRVLFVGLGCENNGLKGIREKLNGQKEGRIAFLNCQGETDEIVSGIKILKKFSDEASSLSRVDCPISDLCIGLKCGGSDGYSGLTANPLVGKITDKIISFCGSAVLTEVPEMFGAEQKMMNKCVSYDVFLQYKKMIEKFKLYYIDNGFPVYENPSPGNREGGITTLEEKSMGCIEKAGTSSINAVIDYGEQVECRGLNILNGPGNDLIATSALGASGCQLILFTTGRGTPFSGFVPTLKISSNKILANKKSSWIDFDATDMNDDE